MQNRVLLGDTSIQSLINYEIDLLSNDLRWRYLILISVDMRFSTNIVDHGSQTLGLW